VIAPRYSKLQLGAGNSAGKSRFTTIWKVIIIYQISPSNKHTEIIYESMIILMLQAKNRLHVLDAGQHASQTKKSTISSFHIGIEQKLK